MKDFNKRPILVYFFTLFGTTTFAMSGSFGWWAPVWALLTVLIFGVGIPAPLFVYKWATWKQIEKPVPILAGCFGSAFLFLSLVLIQQTQDVAGGIFMGLLYYGYPGAIMSFVAFRFLRKRPMA